MTLIFWTPFPIAMQLFCHFLWSKNYKSQKMLWSKKIKSKKILWSKNYKSQKMLWSKKIKSKKILCSKNHKSRAQKIFFNGIFFHKVKHLHIIFFGSCNIVHSFTESITKRNVQFLWLFCQFGKLQHFFFSHAYKEKKNRKKGTLTASSVHRLEKSILSSWVYILRHCSWTSP